MDVLSADSAKLIQAASALLGQDRPAAEILAAVQAIEPSDPQFLKAQHVRALCALKDGAPLTAKALLLDLVEADRHSFPPWVTLARTAAALGAPDDLLALFAGMLPRIPAHRLAPLTGELLHALQFTTRTPNATKDAVFDKFLLPALNLALRQRNMDAALDIESAAYEFYVKSTEEEDHFAASMAKITPLFSRAAEDWLSELPAVKPVSLAEPYKIGFFIHNASMLAHIEVLLNTLKGYRSLPEQSFEARVYCFTGEHPVMETALAGLGVELVKLKARFPETQTSSWQRLLKFRELLAEDGVQELVWVSLVLMMPLAFGLRIAPVQTWWAMKYRNFALDSIDGYVTGSAITRFGSLRGRRWRMGLLGVDDWVDPTLTEAANAIRERYAGKCILMTLGRTEKMQNTAYLTAVIAVLRSNPDAVFLWAGREENKSIRGAFEDGGVLGQTHFIGWVNTRLYAQVADIFIDSFPFPCGFTLYQAMAAGKPVVIYTSPEAAQTGLWAFLKPVLEDGEGDAAEVADMMTFVGDPQSPLISIARTPQDYIDLTQRLIRDASARSAAGLASERFILRYFSDPSAMGRSFARHFVELIEERRMDVLEFRQPSCFTSP